MGSNPDPVIFEMHLNRFTHLNTLIIYIDVVVGIAQLARSLCSDQEVMGSNPDPIIFEISISLFDLIL